VWRGFFGVKKTGRADRQDNVHVSFVFAIFISIKASALRQQIPAGRDQWQNE
jgi:hypothetical protein